MFVVTKTSTVCGDQQNSNGKKFSCKFQKKKKQILQSHKNDIQKGVEY